MPKKRSYQMTRALIHFCEVVILFKNRFHGILRIQFLENAIIDQMIFLVSDIGIYMHL